MVFPALPILKLGALGMRQLAYPFSNFIQMKAKDNKFFRYYICMPPAQFYHWCQVTIKAWLIDLRRPIKVKPLNEAMAIELGAEILGEIIIFILAGTALMLESTRQFKKRSLEESINIRGKDIMEAMRVLEYRQQRHGAHIAEIVRVLGELGKPIKLEKVIKRKGFQEKYKELFNSENELKEYIGLILDNIYFILVSIILIC